MNQEISVELPSIVFTWIKLGETVNINENDEIMVPVYLNKSRKNLIFSLKMNRGQMSTSLLYQKAVALIAWNN